MGNMQGLRAGILQHQPFPNGRLPIVNPVNDGDLKRQRLALEKDGKRLSIRQSALVGLYQSERRSIQILPVAGEGKFEAGPPGFPAGDQVRVSREIGEPLRHQARAESNVTVRSIRSLPMVQL